MYVRFQYNSTHNSCEATSPDELTIAQQYQLTGAEEDVSDYAKHFCAEGLPEFFFGDIEGVKAFATATLYVVFGSHITVEFVAN